ncbi:MAG: hypothetical protein JSR45_00650 [Proteobacteria bacterium]|nr:hypothetical protein [Pseudomonadota bacterium]
MRPDVRLILALWALVGLGLPLVIALQGAMKRDPEMRGPRWSWAKGDLRLTLVSTALYTLAFNLVFITQELFLVLPKALTPGLHPVLFHNNHDWTGHNPLAELEQGAGALVILLVGLGAVWTLKRRPPASPTWRLFLTWVAFNGLFQALPQVVVGAMLPANDVGRAMTFLALGPVTITLAVLLALWAMANAGVWLPRAFLSLAAEPAETATRQARSRLMLRAATLPCVLGTALVIPFRLPGSWDQTILVPVAVASLGVAWVQASAWRARPLAADLPARPLRLVWPALALVVMLLVFQLVLRPGIAF